mgnify:CR=1 FL=1
MEYYGESNTIAKLIGLGILLIIVGFALIFISTVLTAFQQQQGNVNVSGGVLVIFGFIPIGFAFGQHSEIIMIILLILALAIMILGFILRKTHV